MQSIWLECWLLVPSSEKSAYSIYCFYWQGIFHLLLIHLCSSYTGRTRIHTRKWTSPDPGITSQAISLLVKVVRSVLIITGTKSFVTSFSQDGKVFEAYLLLKVVKCSIYSRCVRFWIDTRSLFLLFLFEEDAELPSCPRCCLIPHLLHSVFPSGAVRHWDVSLLPHCEQLLTPGLWIEA